MTKYTIVALSNFVKTMDRHPVGAAFLSFLATLALIGLGVWTVRY